MEEVNSYEVRDRLKRGTLLLVFKRSFGFILMLGLRRVLVRSRCWIRVYPDWLSVIDFPMILTSCVITTAF
jgi:hypothetical protein